MASLFRWFFSLVILFGDFALAGSLPWDGITNEADCNEFLTRAEKASCREYVSRLDCKMRLQRVKVGNRWEVVYERVCKAPDPLMLDPEDDPLFEEYYPSEPVLLPNGSLARPVMINGVQAVPYGNGYYMGTPATLTPEDQAALQVIQREYGQPPRVLSVRQEDQAALQVIQRRLEEENAELKRKNQELEQQAEQQLDLIESEFTDE